jgi:hypothetical protein
MSGMLHNVSEGFAMGRTSVSDILQMCKDFVFQNEFSTGAGESA